MIKFFKNILYLTAREFRILFKNPALLTVIILAPVLYALLFGYTYKEGAASKIKMTIVDLDNTPMSNQLIQMFQDAKSLDLEPIKYVNVDLNNEMIRNRTVAVVVIPKRFEADLLQKNYPEVESYFNASNIVTANTAKKDIQTILTTFNVGIEVKALQKKGLSAEEAFTQFEPFKINSYTLFNPTSNYLVFMWPGLLSVALQQIVLIAMALSLTSPYEKLHFGTEFLNRTHSASVTIFVKMLPIAFFIILHLGFYYYLHHYFEAPIPSPLSSFVVITFWFLLATALLGILVSAVLSDQLRATQVLLVLGTPAFIVGGYIWPYEMMPKAIQYIADILPLTPFLNAFKILLIEKGNLSDVAPYIKYMQIQTLIYFIGALIFVKIKIVLLIRKNKKKETEEIELD